MICDEAKILVSAYQDGELPADRREEIERHLKDCPECARKLQKNLALSEAIRSQSPTYQASESLLLSIERKRLPRPAWSFAAGLAVGLAAMAAVAMLFLSTGSRDFTRELVSDHVRSLMADHLFDVQSTDQHTVKPWFLGKVDFAPAVPNLATDGYPLVGGRLEYLHGRAAAALVYMKAKHVVSVIVMPERQGSAGVGENAGYRVEHWISGDLGYWAVSDVTREDLRAFARSFQSSAGPP